MRRYGGNFKKAKRILALFTIAIACLWGPLFWSGDEINSSINFFSIPITWTYGLILLPIALTGAVNLSRRLFERANR